MAPEISPDPPDLDPAVRAQLPEPPPPQPPPTTTQMPPPKLPDVEASAPSTSQPEPEAPPPPPAQTPTPKLPDVEASAPSTSQPEPEAPPPPPTQTPTPKLPDVEASAPSTSQPEPEAPPPPPTQTPPPKLTDVEASAPPTSQPEPEAPPPPPTQMPPPKLPDVEASAPSASKPEQKAPPPTTVAPPSSTKTPLAEPLTPPSPSSPHSSPPQIPSPASSSPPKPQEAPPPPPPPPATSPPRSSAANEITNADTTDKPVHEQDDDKVVDTTNKQEDNKEDTNPTCSMLDNVLACLNLKKKDDGTDKVLEKKKKLADGTGKVLDRTKSAEDIRAELPDLEKRLRHMQDDLSKLQKFEGDLDKSLKEHQSRVNALINKPKLGPKTRKEIEQVKRDVKILYATIPSAQKLSLLKSKRQSSAQNLSLLKSKPKSSAHFNDEDDEGARLPDLHSDKTFHQSSEFHEYKRLYDELDETQKSCLRCFAVFPKNEVIKKRLMVYWWAGEGFLDKLRDGDPKIETFEDLAEKVFKKLMEIRFIEPVYKKRRQEIHSFKMLPVVHSTVKHLAERDKFFDYDLPVVHSTVKHLAERDKFFDYDSNPELKPQSRVCLVQPEERDDVVDEKELEPALLKVPEKGLLKLETLFNVSKIILDFSPEWFKKLKKLRVLYLGRWQVSPKHHVEVESTDFLEGFQKMKDLRFLSLQGISRIFELPKLLSRLTSLIILDLRACPNLEVLPKEIGMLKKLTHLDISECYMLDRVPKEIASLTELQVLKGFVVPCDPNDKSCTFKQLEALKKLRKLSIITNTKTFPHQEDLTALQKMEKLVNLRIIWGYDFKSKMKEDMKMEVTPPVRVKGCLENVKNFKRKMMEASCTEPPHNAVANLTCTEPDNKGFLETVTKLDLQCYPEKKTPQWLMPRHVKNLKKLYIKGGELQKLSPSCKEDKWDEVEILCLKFSRNLRIEWKEVQASFPKLWYLEKVRCPNSTMFPCDEEGIWIKSGSKAAEPTI